MLEVERTGDDTFVASGPRYPWGGLYGGQIVAHALLAAAGTVDAGVRPHSLRAYFILPGDQDAPVRYDVDRLRDGRSFQTRRVVARQDAGVILNLEASFTAGDESIDVQRRQLPDVPSPGMLADDRWSDLFVRRFEKPVAGSGHAAMWLRWTAPIGDDPMTHVAALAYLSDDVPSDAIRAALGDDTEDWFCVSLDHTVWFHAPARVDEWQLHAFRCDRFVGGRGLAVGEIYARDGVHIATVAQEMLFRPPRQ